MYVFGEFNCLENYFFFLFFPKYKIRLVITLDYLTVKRQKKKFLDEIQNMQTNFNASASIINFKKQVDIFYIINLLFFKKLSYAYYMLNEKFLFEKKIFYKKDYFRAHGFGFNSVVKKLKIKPLNIIFSNKKKNLYIFTPLLASGDNGINERKSYDNILKFFKTIREEIDIKAHPHYVLNFSDKNFLKKLESQNKIKFIDKNQSAEIVIGSYEKVIVNHTSNSIRNYIISSNSTKRVFYSLVNLIDFKKKSTKLFFYQAVDILTNKHKKFYKFPTQN